jgi:glycosyltransferase involved in cell wall biosynthesis
MRVAMVSDRANTHMTELAKALGCRGHDVTVYMRRDRRGLPEETAADGYRIVSVPAGPARALPDDALVPHMERFARFVREHWAANPPDVVHAHHWLSGLAALSAGRVAGVPVVQTFHTLGEIERRVAGLDHVHPPERPDAEKTIAHEAQRIAAACSDELAELVHMGVSRTRISVVSGGVDLETFAPEGALLPLCKYSHRLVAAGELLPRNGFATTIAALRALPDTELVIVGGPDKRRLRTDEHARFLRSFAGSMGVADQVRLARGPRGHAAAAALGRRGRVHALVRPVRLGRARGDGLRRAGGRGRGGRAGRHGRRRDHRPAGAAAQAARAGRGAAPAAVPPDATRAVRCRWSGPRLGAVLLGPGRRRDRPCLRACRCRGPATADQLVPRPAPRREPH